MAIYFRTYTDFSYEFIFTEGRVKKQRIHILINPGTNIKLPSVEQSEQSEINPKSLTHLVAMRTSVVDEGMLNHTLKVAERTNKPIITNKKSSLLLREMGISVKQLRILGFEEEVIDNLKLDPVYKDEIVEEKKNDPVTILKIGKRMGKLIDPRRYLGLVKDEVEEKEVDVTNPLALVITASKNQSILLPLDERGVRHIRQITKAVTPWVVLIPNRSIGETYTLEAIKNAIFLDEKYTAEELLSIPRSNNPGLSHHTYQGGFNQWYEIR